MTDGAKKNLHCYGFLTVISLVLFLSLFLITFFSRQTNTKSMRSLIQNLLVSKYEDKFTVGNRVDDNHPNPIATYAFELLSKDNDVEYVVALRLTTMSGPVIGVFKSVNGVSRFEYIGNIEISKTQTEPAIWDKMPDGQLNYVCKRLADIFGEK